MRDLQRRTESYCDQVACHPASANGGLALVFPSTRLAAAEAGPGLLGGTTHSRQMFDEKLKTKGWTQTGAYSYAKGDWLIEPDTSSWMFVSTKGNPRVFDVHVPGDYESGWTVNLIEHLCGMEDERLRLRAALESIRDNPEAARQTAISALQQCFHNWLLNLKIPEKQTGRVYCAICGALRNS
jgi:hypothetical protein